MPIAIHPPQADLILPLPAAGEQWDPYTVHTHYFGLTVPGKIDKHHPHLGVEGRHLRTPEGQVASEAVNEDQGVPSGADLRKIGR